MYAAFACIKLLESCHSDDAGMGSSADIFHLAILAQLASQIKKVGTSTSERPTAAYNFGSVSLICP